MTARPRRSPSGRPPPPRSDLPSALRLPANDASGIVELTCVCPFEANLVSGAPNSDDVATFFSAAATDEFTAFRARAERRESGADLWPGVEFPFAVGTISTYWSTDDGVSESVAAPAAPAGKEARARANAATRIRAVEVRASSPCVSCARLVY